jgi:HPt (histidine-containing phosphotransfer) domain-containing protein
MTMTRQSSFQRRRHPVDPGGAGAPPLVLDPAAVERLRQLDPDGSRGFLAQVLRTYELSLLKHLASLAEARASADARRAGEIAHTLKSSSASVGAMRFSQSCAELERLAKAGDTPAMVSLALDLEQQGANVLTVVRAMLRA